MKELMIVAFSLLVTGVGLIGIAASMGVLNFHKGAAGVIAVWGVIAFIVGAILTMIAEEL